MTNIDEGFAYKQYEYSSVVILTAKYELYRERIWKGQNATFVLVIWATEGSYRVIVYNELATQKNNG